MKIDESSLKFHLVQFHNLKSGDAFIYNEVLCMRIVAHKLHGDMGQVNAVRLERGGLFFMPQDTLVLPVNSEVKVTNNAD